MHLERKTTNEFPKEELYRLMSIPPAQLSEYFIQLEHTGDLDSFLAESLSNSAFRAYISWYLKWIEKVLDDENKPKVEAAIKKAIEEEKAEEGVGKLPLNLDKKFNKEELFILFSNLDALQLTVGCNNSCNLCGFDVVEGVRDYIPHPQLTTLLNRYGEVIKNAIRKKQLFMLYYGSDFVDYPEAIGEKASVVLRELIDQFHDKFALTLKKIPTNDPEFFPMLKEMGGATLSHLEKSEFEVHLQERIVEQNQGAMNKKLYNDYDNIINKTQDEWKKDKATAKRYREEYSEVLKEGYKFLLDEYIELQNKMKADPENIDVKKWEKRMQLIKKEVQRRIKLDNEILKLNMPDIRNETFQKVGVHLKEKTPAQGIGCIDGFFLTPRGLYNSLSLNSASPEFPQGGIIMPFESFAPEDSESTISLNKNIREYMRNGLILSKFGSFADDNTKVFIYYNYNLYKVEINDVGVVLEVENCNMFDFKKGETEDNSEYINRMISILRLCQSEAEKRIKGKKISEQIKDLDLDRSDKSLLEKASNYIEVNDLK